MTPIYIDHETGEVFPTHRDAMEAYRKGHRIDLYRNRNNKLELVLFWEV